jgi:rhamnogalacturonyl hydrolase YesR
MLGIALFGSFMVAPAVHAQASDSAASAVSAAQSAAQAWLQLVDTQHYDQSWDSAAAVFRSAITKPQWAGAVKEGRAPFEPLGQRTLIAANYTTELPNVPPGQYVVIQYRTQAGHGKTVVETITPARDQDGRWRVAGYYIRPE